MSNTDVSTSSYKVTLIDSIGAGNASDPQDMKQRYRVTFDVTPDLSEEFSVRYETMSPIHAPGQIFPYQYTASRTFNIQAKLISRTIAEASANYNKIRLLKFWTMPAFGIKTTDFERGRPPHVLYLSAYSPPGTTQGMYGHIRMVPTVITSLSFAYPSDVDYTFAVMAGEGQSSEQYVPMPTLWTITVGLLEAHSPREMEEFSITDFAAGTLRGW